MGQGILLNFILQDTMDEINKKIEIVLDMLISETAWAYQRLKSSEPKSIDAFVARNVALNKSKELIKEKLNEKI